MSPIQNHGAAINARRRRFMMSQFRQMMKPPKAGVSRKLPRIAITGLQIVSPSGGVAGTGVLAGIPDPGAGMTLGKGGGPEDGIGMVGNGGGLVGGVSANFSSVPSVLVVSGIFFPGVPGPSTTEALGNAAKNSEIGFQADF